MTDDILVKGIIRRLLSAGDLENGIDKLEYLSLFLDDGLREIPEYLAFSEKRDGFTREAYVQAVIKRYTENENEK